MFIFCDYKRGLILLLDPSFSVLSFYSVALMNHSCDPNVIVTYNGTVAEVRAVQEINPGEEVRKTPETVMFFIQTLPVNGKANVILSSLSSNPHLMVASSSSPSTDMWQLHRPALSNRRPSGEVAGFLFLHMPVFWVFF